MRKSLFVAAMVATTVAAAVVLSPARAQPYYGPGGYGCCGYGMMGDYGPGYCNRIEFRSRFVVGRRILENSNAQTTLSR